jgi:uncharacterized protein YqgQ
MYVWVTFQEEGFHSWDNAPEEVSFLRDRHRHLFHFRVQIQVFYDDREIEFFTVKKQLKSLYSKGILSRDNFSCEQLASNLLVQVRKNYGNSREYKISVSEDQENGAIVTHKPVQVV